MAKRAKGGFALFRFAKKAAVAGVAPDGKQPLALDEIKALDAICDAAGTPDGVCWESTARLAKRRGNSERTIQWGLWGRRRDKKSKQPGTWRYPGIWRRGLVWFEGSVDEAEGRGGTPGKATRWHVNAGMLAHYLLPADADKFGKLLGWPTGEPTGEPNGRIGSPPPVNQMVESVHPTSVNSTSVKSNTEEPPPPAAVGAARADSDRPTARQMIAEDFGLRFKTPVSEQKLNAALRGADDIHALLAYLGWLNRGKGFEGLRAVDTCLYEELPGYLGLARQKVFDDLWAEFEANGWPER